MPIQDVNQLPPAVSAKPNYADSLHVYSDSRIIITESRKLVILPDIYDVHVGSEAGVVCQIVAWVVGVFINHNWVRIPTPVGDIDDIWGRNAEIPVVKPEARWAASGQDVGMAPAKCAWETAMLPGMGEAIAGIPALVSDPSPVAVNVRRIRMASLIVEMTRSRLSLWPLFSMASGSGPVRGNVPAAGVGSAFHGWMRAALIALIVLRACGYKR